MAMYIKDTLKASISGNAGTATKLATARSINGTNFDGSAGITTANWGTARTLTIGNKGQSVNGSANVTWSLADIGALPTAGGNMTGHITFNNDNQLKWKTPAEYTNKNTNTAIASGTVLTMLHYNNSGNLHLGSGTYDNYLSTGSLYLSSPNHAYIRTRNNGTICAQINDTTRVKIEDSKTTFINNSPALSFSSGNTYYIAKRTDTGTECRFGVGEGGTNHGVYSTTLGKWMVYGDASNVYLRGNAETATKLQTARTINSISFDGSSNINVPLEYHTCSVQNDNTNNYHHILSTGQCTGDYMDKSITIFIVNHYNGAGTGIAKATLRTNKASDGAGASGELRWLVRSGFAENQLCYNIRTTAKDTYMDVFYKSSGTYNSVTWYILGEGRRGDHTNQWIKYNTTSANSYTETKMKAIRSYTSTLISAADDGKVKNAVNADKLMTARSIGLGGLLSGSANFDGSGNITISASVAAPPKSGDWFSGGIPTVSTGGVLEIGRYIDFHNSDGSTNDYDVRLQSNTAGPIVLNLPTSAGTLARTADKTAGWSTARTLTVGKTGKSVDGTGNVSWSIKEIMGYNLTIATSAPGSPSTGDIWIDI